MQWDSADWQKERDRKLRNWFKGDLEATACMVAISSVCETWDDLYDGDPVKPSSVEQAFVALFLQLQDNPFFRKHQDQITAVMVVVINGWADSNSLVSSGKKDDRIKAYILRNLGLELIPLFAYWTGGYQHMRDISLDMREFVAHETFEQWEREHA